MCKSFPSSFPSFLSLPLSLLGLFLLLLMRFLDISSLSSFRDKKKLDKVHDVLNTLCGVYKDISIQRASSVVCG